MKNVVDVKYSTCPIGQSKWKWTRAFLTASWETSLTTPNDEQQGNTIPAAVEEKLNSKTIDFNQYSNVSLFIFHHLYFK